MQPVAQVTEAARPASSPTAGAMRPVAATVSAVTTAAAPAAQASAPAGPATSAASAVTAAPRPIALASARPVGARAAAARNLRAGRGDRGRDARRGAPEAAKTASHSVTFETLTAHAVAARTATGSDSAAPATAAADGGAPAVPAQAPERDFAPTGGAAASGVSASFLFGGLALLVGGLWLAGPRLRRHLSLPSVVCRPAAFVAVLERPG